ncbi:HesA/MoeB/ThiF family protein [Pararhodobacter aggregans]|uniref:Thiamine biosynthesis protein ThiF n=1 Tax=Pararhodobacter aggregans TaxID=404875 RepID=A0A2T7UN70_9RHOB|nr:HesA/MoeB/ThiF family protein [Pararhodobacter aggregans]PTX02513.1 molybdopterin/thiamine biosynthesis adenylyltransferase [Pararhodobacter aggregans]PVE46117.1 thiamine biosynthesis protein ThiF [Pararhodobacter aggregans]
MTRYDRQIAVPGVGPEGQARLGAAQVLVVGAGGLGSAVIPALAAAGLGHLTIADPDRVSLSNLHRQTLYRAADIGQPKAPLAAARAAEINSDCRTRGLPLRLDPANAPALIAEADLVIDAADSFAVTYTLSDLCKAAGKPLVSASVLGRAGYAGAFCGTAPSVRAVFPDLPEQAASCASAGVLGPAVAALGAVQAQMALTLLIGLSPGPLGRLVTLDMARWHFGGFDFRNATEAPGFGFLAPAQIEPGDHLIDLRPAGSVATLPGARALGLDDLARWPIPPGRVVLCCSSGLRAWRGASVLAARGATRLALLADGQ